MKFVLLHGGWQGGWCWALVARHLRRGGHEVLAPTMPGMEPDAADRSIGSLSSFTASAVDLIISLDWHDVVLVGHSGGGAVAQGVIEHVPDRIRRAVYMSARILLDGECILDLGNQAKRFLYAEIAAARPDNTVPMEASQWIEGLCHDMSEAEARRWLPRLVPCPYRWLVEPAALPIARWRKAPSSYIFLDDERPRATALYRQMADRLFDPIRIHAPGGHQAMLSQPEATAAAIARAA